MHMKFKIFIFLFIFVLAQAYAFAHVQPVSPLGGEHYYPGTETKIQWTEAQDHGESNWDLFYSIDDGVSWIDIAIDLSKETLEYVWTIPNIESKQVKVRIVQDNKSGTDYESISNFFTISKNPPDPEPEPDVITELMNDEQIQNDEIKPKNYPNPFSSATDIQFFVPGECRVQLTIMNLQGKTILLGLDKIFVRGEYFFTWHPDGIPNGMYMYRLEIGGVESVDKMILKR